MTSPSHQPRQPPRKSPGGHPALTVGAVVILLLLGFVAVKVAVRSSGGSAGGHAGAQPAPWWRRSFPPASVTNARAIPEVSVRSAGVIPGQSGGSLDGGTTVDGGGAFLWGWAWDSRTHAPAAAVVLVDNGEQIPPPVHVFRERPDVVAYWKDSRLLETGWSLWLPAGRLTEGRNVFAAFAVLADGKLAPLDGQAVVEIPKHRSGSRPSS